MGQIVRLRKQNIGAPLLQAQITSNASIQVPASLATKLTQWESAMRATQVTYVQTALVDTAVAVLSIVSSALIQRSTSSSALYTSSP